MQMINIRNKRGAITVYFTDIRMIKILFLKLYANVIENLCKQTNFLKDTNLPKLAKKKQKI